MGKLEEINGMVFPGHAREFYKEYLLEESVENVPSDFIFCQEVMDCIDTDAVIDYLNSLQPHFFQRLMSFIQVQVNIYSSELVIRDHQAFFDELAKDRDLQIVALLSLIYYLSF